MNLELPDSLLPQPVVLLAFGQNRDAASGGERCPGSSPAARHGRRRPPYYPDILSQDGDFQVILPHGILASVPV